MYKNNESEKFANRMQVKIQRVSALYISYILIIYHYLPPRFRVHVIVVRRLTQIPLPTR